MLEILEDNTKLIVNPECALLLMYNFLYRSDKIKSTVVVAFGNESCLC